MAAAFGWILPAFLFVFYLSVEAKYTPSLYYWPSICPHDKPHIPCDPNPCYVHKCPMRPDAFCEPNQCGGCAVDFFSKGKQVSYEECFGHKETNSPNLLCKVKESVSKCEAHPNALAVCGHFYKYGRRLLPHECSVKKHDEGECGSKAVPCLKDPCKLATCNSTTSTAICVPDYCTCSYHFVDGNNNRIKCGESTFKPKEIECPEKVKKSQTTYCKVDACTEICKDHPEAICIYECGSCEPSFYDRKGNKLDSDSCKHPH